MRTEAIELDDMDDVTFTEPVRRTAFAPSRYQAAIFDWIETGTGDAIVNAVAGSGKTTTLEQASRRLPRTASALFVAFNKHIAEELTKRLDGMECRTIHGMGMATLTKRLTGNVRVDANKYRKLARAEARDLNAQMPTIDRGAITDALTSLVDYAQATLTRFDDVAGFESLVRHFAVTLPCPLRDLLPGIQAILRRGEENALQGKEISFSDMVWLPAVWNLQPRAFDWVFVDECQDLNAAQLDLVLKMRAQAGRMLFVGDKRQAIYGFSGADAESYDRIKLRTGAREFPLSISYRCPVLVIREAQAIVPEIEPKPGAPLGTVRWIKESSLYGDVQEGDLILCRMTAPLITVCLELIKMRVPARVRGRDIGALLCRTVEAVAGMPDFTYRDFCKFLTTYTELAVTKARQKPDNEGTVERLLDTEAALFACHAGFQTATHESELCDGIAGLFSDDRPGVWLSTVHRAKGLEADRVFILRPERLPLIWKGQQAWEAEQEWNLRYVAVTRAKSELVYVETAKEA